MPQQGADIYPALIFAFRLSAETQKNLFAVAAFLSP
jgi:hypothetical protein